MLDFSRKRLAVLYQTKGLGIELSLLLGNFGYPEEKSTNLQIITQCSLDEQLDILVWHTVTNSLTLQKINCSEI